MDKLKSAVNESGFLVDCDDGQAGQFRELRLSLDQGRSTRSAS